MLTLSSDWVRERYAWLELRRRYRYCRSVVPVKQADRRAVIINVDLACGVSLCVAQFDPVILFAC